jgi:hypothetical protein
MPAGFICSILAAAARTDSGNPPNSVISVIMTDVGGTFADVGFVAVDEAKREMLAVALAAISNQANVNVLVDVPTGVGPPPRCYSLEIVAS